jgi:hypothetical protein
MPYVGDILDAAFSLAQAIIVLMTPDDEARLRKDLREPTDEAYESVLTGQPRQNVIFEAGMAMAHSRDRTIIVELGKPRPFSDIRGRHPIRLDNSAEKRKALARRLADAGCPCNLSGDAWLRQGDFSPPPELKSRRKLILLLALLGLALICSAAFLAYKYCGGKCPEPPQTPTHKSHPLAVRREPAMPPDEWFLTFSDTLDSEARTDRRDGRVVGFGRGTYRLSWDGFPDGPSPAPFQLVLTATSPYKVKAVGAKQDSSGRMVRLEVVPGDKSEEVVVKVPSCAAGDEVYVSVYVSWSDEKYCPNVGEGCCTEVFALKSIDWTTKAEEEKR